MLTGLLRGHREHLVADLWRVYGLSLRDVRGVWTLREFAACVAYLPDDAAVRRAVDQDAALTTDHYLLQAIERDLRVLAWQRTQDGQATPPRNAPELLALTVKERAEAARKLAESQPEMPDSMSLDELRERIPLDRPGTSS